MLAVILGAFEHPEVRLHGLLAGGRVALGEERGLVGGGYGAFGVTLGKEAVFAVLKMVAGTSF